MKLSKFFDWKEFGVNENSDLVYKFNVMLLSNCLMDKIRDAYGEPIYINSGLRSPEHNLKVGGVYNSQHLTGHACDFTGKNFNKLLRTIQKLEDKGIISYDQMIIYRRRRFIHISYVSNYMNRLNKFFND